MKVAHAASGIIMLNSLTLEIEAQLRASLPDDRFAAAEARHLEEPRGRYVGRAGLVATPRSTQEVAMLIKAAGAARVGVIHMAAAPV